jgi:hypothetical protein
MASAFSLKANSVRIRLPVKPRTVGGWAGRAMSREPLDNLISAEELRKEEGETRSADEASARTGEAPILPKSGR